MKFVQFFKRSAISAALIEATGDRAVIVYDERLRHADCEDDADKECRKRGFLAWQFWKGDTFTRAHSIGERHTV